MKVNVRIVEVGPRDGLQNEKQILTVEQRVEFVKRLLAAGLDQIEVGAFVSPKWVPQMENSTAVINSLFSSMSSAELKNNEFSALVPNLIGLENALTTKIKRVAVFGACSESFSRKNINCSVAESYMRFREVVEKAGTQKIAVRGYLSVAFGCPYEGAVSEARVVKLVKSMLKMGIYEVSIGDTIGVATPKQVKAMVKKLVTAGVPLKKVAMHFHDTRGTALANVAAALDLGIRNFDSSVGGLGGCPYAKGASGNLATEDLCYLLKGMGFTYKGDLHKLIETKNWLQTLLNRTLPSKVGAAGMPNPPVWN